LFGQIFERVFFHDPYFQGKPDAICKTDFSSYQKCSTAIHMLAYAVADDLVDVYAHERVNMH
jgi:hypothetical protein